MKQPLMVTGPLMADTLQQLEQAYELHRYDLADDATRADMVEALAPRLVAIATRGDKPLGGALMRRLPKLRMIASSGAGYDGIDIDSARALGIAVTHTPDAVTECVADMAWFLIIATVRRLLVNDRHIRSGQWRDGPVPLTTHRVNGSRLGILGLGRIGKAIARRGEAFNMAIAYHGRTRQEGVDYRWYADAAALARDVDILVCAIPGRAANQGLVGRDVIDALGPQGYFINVSRGTVVDEPYLVDALVNGRLAGAGLDVFADEPNVPAALAALDNVVLQPHAGSGTLPTRNAMGQSVVDNLQAFFAGQPLLTPIPAI